MRYQSQSGRGGGALLLSSLMVLLVLILLLALAPELTGQQGWVLLFLLVLLAIYVAYSKLTEPTVSIEFSPSGIRYYHRRGSWLLPWGAFAYARVPEIGGEPLNFIGFKVSNYPAFLAHLPLRLAVRLLTEQRHLLLAAVRQNCPSGTCPSSMLLETGDFYWQQHRFHGVLAMFAHRMQRLSQLTEFDLFIPLDAVTAPADDFCRTVNRARLQYIPKQPEDTRSELL